MGGITATATQESTVPSGQPIVQIPTIRRYIHGFRPPPIFLMGHTQTKNSQPRVEIFSAEAGEFAQHSENKEMFDDIEMEEATSTEVKWKLLIEDTSRPSAEELRMIESKPERSALDHQFWEDKLMLEKEEDPEVTFKAYGRMEWVVHRFNGSTSNANLEPFMRSDVFRIGGLDWQLKFYPRGREDDHLSVFLECVSMLSNDYVEFEEFDNPIFPFLKGAPRPQRRRAVTVQYTIIMYNPDDPRVYESRTGAHLFRKKVPEGGFPYFSKVPYKRFNKRRMGQRRPLLQNDQLAFIAHVQIIDDPTFSIGYNPMGRPDDSTEVFGLRSFSHETPWRSLAVILLHFRPFRDLIRRHKGHGFAWLKRTLTLMYARKYSGRREPTMSDGRDFMECFDRLCNMMEEAPSDSSVLSRVYRDVLGEPNSTKNAWGANRLDTVTHPSIQDAINHRTDDLSTSMLLVLELTRHCFDPEDRRWIKHTNKVEVQDRIITQNHAYILYAFVTHTGPLKNGDYHAYVRPQGFGKGWYEYGCGEVNRLTEWQARGVHSGTDGHAESQVTCAVIYVRESFCNIAFMPIFEEALLPEMVHWEDASILFNDETDEQAAETPVTPDDIRRYLSRAGESTTPNCELFRLNGGNDITMQRSGGHDAEGVSDIRPLPYNNSLLVPLDLHEAFIRKHCKRDAVWPSGGNETRVFSDWLGKELYSGELLNDKMHGFGRHIAWSGNHYEGNFSQGTYHGQGKITYGTTGDVWEGIWRDGLPHGRGKMTINATGAVIEGNWMFGAIIDPSILRGFVIDDARGLCSLCHERKDDADFHTCSHRLTCLPCSKVEPPCQECHDTQRYRALVTRAM